MNIQNLNTEEQLQLQQLLNKMNNVEKVQYMDPVVEMVDEIIENFDFDKVERVMECLGWKWSSYSGSEQPSISQLINRARILLINSANLRLGEYKDEYWEQGIINGTGGFTATAHCDETKTKITGLKLEFTVEEYSVDKD
jgi:hypothetical protein